MSASRYPVNAVIGAGLFLGIAGDALLRVGNAPGLNMFLWAALVAGATVLLHRHAGRTLDVEAAIGLVTAVLFTGLLAWRDSPALKLLALGCAIVAFALPAWRAGAAWMRSAGIAEYVGALTAAGAHAVFGSALTAADIDWESLRARRGTQDRWHHAAAGVRGLVIATPFIIVFGSLFVAADAVFAQMVGNVVRVDFERLASHAVLIGFLGWVSTGYMRGFLRGTRPAALASHARPAPLLSITETGVALALLDLLFLVFVIVQFRYLFGGSALVEVTPGLTYAEYARRGFFELVLVAALMLPLLLSADAALRREGARDEVVFRALAGVQIVLLLAVMASAMQRMRLYQSAYGLTEQRFYATALLILLAVVVLWFTVTVLRGRRRRFAFGALSASLATVLILTAVNPDAIIARTNIARGAGATDATTTFDASYVSSLSADAVPTLIAALPTLPPQSRCRVAWRLLNRWGPETSAPLRAWSWSAARARTAVELQADRVKMMAGDDPRCA